MEKGLAAFEKLSKEERSQAKLPEKASRLEDGYPEDGLALKVYVRDLPAEGRDTKPWNQDRAWLKKGEVEKILPETLAKGEKGDGKLLARRLAMCALLDTVKGESERFEKDDVKEAQLELTVQKVEGTKVTLRLTGKTRTHAEGKWPVRGYDDSDAPKAQKRGITLALEGAAVWDTTAKRFTAFELAAVGTRFGGTQFNARGKDLAEAPIGFWIELDQGKTRVAPAFLWAYGW
ncbi:MAG TPA: hypothetical protein VFF73_08550 [Planctomycetota bacterium]|nr:hypothetical protein [Planctomycetota bacterium]